MSLNQDREIPQVIGSYQNNSFNNINQPINNLNQHLVANDQENQANITFPRPEMVYCIENTQTAQQYLGSYEDKGVHVFITALGLVQRDLNLNLNNLQIIGNCDLLSTPSFEQHVIQPIFNNNQHIPYQQIKLGKVIFCCNFLQTNAYFHSKRLIARFILTFIYSIVSILFTFVGNDINQTFTQAALGVQIVQLFIMTVAFILFLVGMKKCSPSHINASFYCLPSIIISFILYVVYIVFNPKAIENTELIGSSYFALQMAMIILLYIGGAYFFALLQIVRMYMKRLCVLLKQIDESHIV